MTERLRLFEMRIAADNEIRSKRLLALATFKTFAPLWSVAELISGGLAIGKRQDCAQCDVSNVAHREKCGF